MCIRDSDQIKTNKNFLNENGIFERAKYEKFLLENNHKNDIFNIAAENFMTNLDVARTIMSWIGKDNEEECLEFVENRWGQDIRYAVNSSKIRKLGWRPKIETGLHKWF